MTVTLHVCITCRRPETTGEALPRCADCPSGSGAKRVGPACTGCCLGPAEGVEQVRAGAQLLKEILACSLPEGVTVNPVECLSACSQGCSVALSAPGKWSYVYGRIDPCLDAPAIIQGVAAYAASADGIVPWRQRPEIFRKQSLARIPPLASPVEPPDV